MFKPAVFLDRDGTLNEEVGHVSDIRELKIFPYVRDCIETIHSMGYLAIVISNQSGVARGVLTEEKLKEINEELIRITGVDAVYYCPHLPDGVLPGYTVQCNCRKPQTGMIDRACMDFQIDIKSSVMIGDRAADIQLGKNMGISTILLQSGYGTQRLEWDVSPDYICVDLKEAVEILVKNYKYRGVLKNE